MDLSISIPLEFLLTILALHTFADFFLQTRWMAKNKSSSHMALLSHVTIYGAALLPFGWKYALANAILHYFTDLISSQGTKITYSFANDCHDQRGKDFWMYWFFGIIGVDQAIHLACLFLTYPLIGT